VPFAAWYVQYRLAPSTGREVHRWNDRPAAVDDAKSTSMAARRSHADWFRAAIRSRMLNTYVRS
jgi:hypothetical protein